MLDFLISLGIGLLLIWGYERLTGKKWAESKMPERVLPSPRYYRYPAQVLGCLASGKITVTLCPGVGLADGGVNTELPAHLIPTDLRMPNSEFDVLFDRHLGSITKVLRKDEPQPESD